MAWGGVEWRWVGGGGFREGAADADSPVEIYNLVPGVDYYKVLSGGQTLRQGGVTPVGPLRMICIYQGARPLRELVYNWATSETQDDLGNEYVAPLTDDEIARLRSHLLVLE